MRSSLSRPVPLRAGPPLAFPGQRVGLMGGSFNPPHAAHLLAAETALKRLGLDQLWWMVTPGNPLKPRIDLAPLATRLAASRTLASHPKIRVTGFEASPYTVDTVAALLARCRGVRFVLVLGADSLAGLHRWQRWRALVRAVPIAVIDRPGWRLAALASPAGRTLAPFRLPESTARGLADCKPPAWVFLTNPLSRLSSTEIRGRAASRLTHAGHTQVDWPESNQKQLNPREERAYSLVPGPCPANRCIVEPVTRTRVSPAQPAPEGPSGPPKGAMRKGYPPHDANRA